jgi:hypothetical protein
MHLQLECLPGRCELFEFCKRRTYLTVFCMAPSRRWPLQAGITATTSSSVEQYTRTRLGGQLMASCEEKAAAAATTATPRTGTGYTSTEQTIRTKPLY